MTRDPIYFVRTELDRCANMREQNQRIRQLKKFKPCHYVPVYKGNHIYPESDEAFHISKMPLGAESRQSFLGILNDELWFSCRLTEKEAMALETQLESLRAMEMDALIDRRYERLMSYGNVVSDPADE